MKKLFLLAAAAICCTAFGAKAPQKNLALGKKLHYDSPPLYRLTKDANDNYDLTNGKIRNDDIWFYRDSCGWAGAPFVGINIDLGKPSSIDNVRLHLAQGNGGVRYPEKIILMAGNSPDRMVEICDIIALNKKDIPPYEKGRFRSWVSSRKGHRNIKARFLKLIVFPSRAGNLFFMVDEIEVLEGAANAPTVYTGKAMVGTTADYVRFMRAKDRLAGDIEILKNNAKIAGIKYDFNALKKKIMDNPADLIISAKRKDTDFPNNIAQKKIAEVNQQFMAQKGMKGTVLWSSVRWDRFNSFSYPQDNAACHNLKMSAGEIRNLALNFSNADKAEKTVAFTVDSPFPVSVMRGYSSVDAFNFFNSNRLEKQKTVNGKYQFKFLPGESIQYFFRTTIPANTKPGDYKITVSTADGAKSTFNIKIGKLKFPAELSTEYGTWDYLNALGCHGQPLDKNNLQAAMALIREYQMNVTWGHEAALPWAKPDMFDDNDNLIKPLDFKKFDAWVNAMPGFKRYALFGGSGLKRQLNTGFDAVKEPVRFKKRMTSYMNALMRHIEVDLKMDVEKFMFHFLDEVQSDRGRLELRIWCDSIHEAKSPSGKKFDSFGNPFFDGWDFYSYPEIDMFQPSNSACRRDLIMRYMAIAGARNDDTRFGLYSCAGEARQLDPYIYYGGNFRLGFLFKNYAGSSFWNLATAPRDISDYNYTGSYYSPWYFKGNEIFGSRQYEAIWEGRCDYEYLALLKKVNNMLVAAKDPLAIASKNLCGDIQRILFDELNDPADGVIKSKWTYDSKRDNADIYRDKIWDLMEKVAVQHPEFLQKINWK